MGILWYQCKVFMYVCMNFEIVIPIRYNCGIFLAKSSASRKRDDSYDYAVLPIPKIALINSVTF